MPSSHLFERVSAIGTEAVAQPHHLTFPIVERRHCAFDLFGELAADVSDPRTQLANWIASEGNPLTPRVFVNRIWQHHFGTGIVKTANDFGLHGEAPTHGELLDWLSAELMDGGWELKRLHRRIVSSGAYRQASRLGEGARGRGGEEERGRRR